MPTLLNEPVIARWQLGVIAAITGGIVGKCVGLWWSHRTYKKLQHEFNSLVENQSKTNGCSIDTNQNGGISHG